MDVLDAQFIAGATTLGQLPPPARSEIAFAGRSNVGKSSLINRLLGRTRSAVARVSGTPGKTQEINFYRVAVRDSERDHEFFLVDLPGYGFAKAPLEVRRRWRPLIEAYLGGTPELRGVVQLIDVRHGPSADDHRMLEYLAGTGLPTLFALTKVDKLKSTQREARLAEAMRDLGVDPEQAVPFSAVTGEGRDELLDSIRSLLNEES